ncbi:MULTISPECIES: hypothetical protein [unclassified Streptomyces]|uniref:hypothetical protein n=1 Tax=unclassified Streptomyces TaxID=2593676 RepID=UPI00344CA19A
MVNGAFSSSALPLATAGAILLGAGAAQAEPLEQAPAAPKTKVQAPRIGADSEEVAPEPVSLDVEGTVALTGRVSDDVRLQGARIDVWARPNEDIQKKLEPGDTVPRFHLPRSAVTAEGDEFAIVLDRKSLEKQFIWEGDIAQLEIEIVDPKTGKMSFTTASVRSVGDDLSGRKWVDPLEHPASGARPRISAVEPVLLDVTMKQAPGTLDADIDRCGTQKVEKEYDAWADIGETFPVDDGGGGMKFTEGSTAKFTVAVNLEFPTGSWSDESSSSMTSGKTYEWPAWGAAAGDDVGKPRKYQVEVRYQLIKCSVPPYNMKSWHVLYPSAYTGPARHQVVDRPNWIGSDFSKCGPVTASLWSRSDGEGGSQGNSWKASKGITELGGWSGGFDLKVEREWSKDSTITYKMGGAGGANWLCGSDEKPGLASKVGQFSKILIKDCSNSKIPVATAVQRKAAPEATFNNYAKNTSNGWTGGDSTYSVRLPDGRILWLYSDTFLGPLNSNGTRPTSAPLVNNTFVIQDGSSLSTVQGGTSSSPAAIMPPPATSTADHPRWYWLGDGMIGKVDNENHLQVIYHQWEKFGPGGWDFGMEKVVVATFALNNLKSPKSVTEIPVSSSRGSRIQWGAAILPASMSGDGYTYIYGIDDAPTNKALRIARVKGSDLSQVDKWVFYNADLMAWMPDWEDGTHSTVGIANEFSVTKWDEGNSFVLISQDSIDAFSGKIRIWSNCQPWAFGRLLDHDVLTDMPEVGLFGSYGDKNIFAYNAHAHPTLASGGRWTLSYNVNSFDSTVGAQGAHYKDPSIYRPRFVSFKLVPFEVNRSQLKLEVGKSSAEESRERGVGEPPCTTCRGLPR